MIDEHGSVTGLVTLEDLLEEIVGEIQDEYDWEERPVERLRDGSLVVEGTVSAAELRESYEVPLPESEEFETVAGFMLEQLGLRAQGRRGRAVGDYRLTVVDVEQQPHQQGQDREAARGRRRSRGAQRVSPRIRGSGRGRRSRRSEAAPGAGSARPGAARSRAAAAGRSSAGGGTSKSSGEVSPPDQERAQLLLRDLGPRHDVRGQGHDDVGLRGLVLVAREEAARGAGCWRGRDARSGSCARRR